MKLSIIIPIYKVEKYVEKCIRSCINQNKYIIGNHYEIICVNDGTPDNSANIAKKIALEYPGIKIIEQENKGLSAARNVGLKYAQGEYVWFVDSDDWIEPDALTHIIPSLINDIDLLQIEYRYTYNNPTLNKDANKNPIKGIIDGKSQTLNGGLHTPAQFVLCKRAFLLSNNLKFREGIYHEDGEFRPRSLLLATKVASISNVCYNYFQRNDGNIMSNFTEKNMKDLMLVMNELDTLASKQEINVKKALYDKLGLFMNTFLSGCLNSEKIQKESIIKILKENKILFKRLLHCKNIYYIFEFSVFYFNVNLGIFIYRTLKSL